MKLHITKNRFSSYLKKINQSESEYKKRGNASLYVFYADREDWGTNQIVKQTQNVYDDGDFGSMENLENICKDLFYMGFKNIRIEQIKRYGKKLKSCPVIDRIPMVVYEYQYK